MKNSFTIIIAVLITLFGRVYGQVAGDPDSTFNDTGKVIYDYDMFDLYKDVKVQPDGKIIAVGSSMASTYMTSVIVVSRLLDNGAFDPSFGTNGHFVYSQDMFADATKCIIKDDGKILICGFSTDYTTYNMLIIQLDEYGNPDPEFGTNGVAKVNTSSGELNVSAMTLQEGKILLAGYSLDSEYRNAPVLLRLTETGVLDTSFGVNGIATIPITETDNEFSALALQSDGKILAAGHISNGLSWFSLLIARFDQNGNIDSTYATDGVVNLNLNNVDDEFYDMQLQDNDEVILTGFTVDQTNYNYHLLLMKFDANGMPVTSFGNNGNVTWGDVPYTFGDAIVIQPGGKILIAGCTGGLMPDNNDWALWRFNPDGNLDNTFGTNGLTTTEFFGNADEALGIALSADKIILAGKTRNAENTLDFAIAEYWNDIHVAVTEVAVSQIFSVSPNPVKQNSIVNLVYELKQPEAISVELISFTGSSIMVWTLGQQEAGNHSCQFILPSTLSGGIYYLRIKGPQYASMNYKVVVID
jgi:uncharacterized delta-60 repeat protein